jgi:rubrerythrin
MSNTQDNLQEAFAGESQASRRYLYFAEKADAEGHPVIARLFRAASEAETVHARNHLRTMSEIKTTSDNLKAAIDGEYYEFSQMYPGFITQAKAEANQSAETVFTWANQVEKTHHSLYRQALEVLNEAKDLKDEPYFVCQRCGYTVSGEAPEKCPICGAPLKTFKQVD